MKVSLQHIVVILAALFISASCSRDDAEVIPRGKMARIYAEMLVQDQWINSTPEIRRVADTSLVYEPLLERYGYDLDDYLASVDKYMDDPERFARIMREAGDIIEDRIKEIREELDRQAKLEELRLRIEKMTLKSDFRPEEFFPYLFDEPYVHYYDSLAVEIDTVIEHYRLIDLPTTDTLYEGVRMILQSDTLAVDDSLALKDSLALLDSLAAAEGLPERVKRTSLKGEIERVENEILFDEPVKKTGRIHSIDRK